MIIATHVSAIGEVFALADDSLAFQDYQSENYAVVFTLEPNSQRTYCYADTCSKCPFTWKAYEPNSDEPSYPDCQTSIIKRPAYYLTLFGITAKTNPEYFI